MKFKNLFRGFFLQLFAEGDTGSTGGMGVDGADPTAQQGVAEESAEHVPDAQEKTVDEEAEFEKLVKGKFAKQYNKRVKAIVDERVKGQREGAARLEKQAPILERLAAKYGVKPDDYEGISAAMEAESPEFEEAAIKRGLTVEQYRDVRRIERENEQLKARSAEAERKERANAIYAQWQEEGKTVKAIYPGFQLDTEMENKDFQTLLRCGVNMQTAYEVLHRDEIIPAAMQYAAQSASNKLAKSIAANQSRPTENGVGAAAKIGSEVSKLTGAEVKDICERVARGERVSFG